MNGGSGAANLGSFWKFPGLGLSMSDVAGVDLGGALSAPSPFPQGPWAVAAAQTLKMTGWKTSMCVRTAITP